MGVPINKLICASNANNVLTDFIATGTYDKKRDFHTTISPSMDILVSSNLERLLYHLTGGDDAKVAMWMKELSENGCYTVDDATKKALTDLFVGGCCDDKQTQKTIGEIYAKENYLCDTHTAVAFDVYEQYVRNTGDKTPTVIASTASPYKFSRAVLSSLTEETLPEDEFATVQALSDKTNTPVPAPLKALKEAKERFSLQCEVDEMPQVVLSGLGIN